MAASASDPRIRSRVYADLRRILRTGFYLLQPDRLIELPALPAFGGTPTSPANAKVIRAGLRQAIDDFGEGTALYEVALCLFGLTDETAGASIDERYGAAGEIQQLPRTLSASAIRRPGGLRDQVLYELVDMLIDRARPLTEVRTFSRRPLPVTRGFGYRHLLAEIDVVLYPQTWRKRTTTNHFAIQAYRDNVDIYRYAWKGNDYRLVDLSLQPGDHGNREIGKLPRDPDALHLGVWLFVLLGRSLRSGECADITITQETQATKSPSGIGSHAYSIARTPCELTLRVHVPRRLIPWYRRVHEVTQNELDARLNEEYVERTDDSPMIYHESAPEPFTRYMLEWEWP